MQKDIEQVINECNHHLHLLEFKSQIVKTCKCYFKVSFDKFQLIDLQSLITSQYNNNNMEMNINKQKLLTKLITPMQKDKVE